LNKHNVAGKTVAAKDVSDFTQQTSESKTLPYFIADKGLILEMQSFCIKNA
jgi:DNA polymerase-4